MNKEIKCSSCVKIKTQYCPCSIDCMATDTYPFYQDKRMMLEENANLKQVLNEIREYCKFNDEPLFICESDYDYDEELELSYYDSSFREDILQIIDKVLGDEDNEC